MKATAGEKLEYGEAIYIGEDGKAYRAEGEMPLTVPCDGVTLEQERLIQNEPTKNEIAFNQSPPLGIGTTVMVVGPDWVAGPFAVESVNGSHHTAVWWDYG